MSVLWTKRGILGPHGEKHWRRFLSFKISSPKLRHAPLKHPSAWKLAGQISQLQTLNLSQNIFASHLLEAQGKLFNWLNMSSQHRPQRRRIRTSQRFYTRTNPVTVGLHVGLQVVCSGKIRWSEITFYLEQTGPKITWISRLLTGCCSERRQRVVAAAGFVSVAHKKTLWIFAVNIL